jgi:hypothetical protein
MAYEFLWYDECKLIKNEGHRILQGEGNEISIHHVKLNANLFIYEIQSSVLVIKYIAYTELKLC